MHKDLQKLIEQYTSGRITKHECVHRFPGHFEYTFNADELTSVVAALPDEIRAEIERQVSIAPSTTEEWARFRTPRSTGDIDRKIAPVDPSVRRQTNKQNTIDLSWRGARHSERKVSSLRYDVPLN